MLNKLLLKKKIKLNNKNNIIKLWTKVKLNKFQRKKIVIV